MKISHRQKKILEYISQNGHTKRLDIEKYISSVDDKISKITIVRDLNALLEQNLITKSGSAKSITYSVAPFADIYRDFDPKSYFLNETDKRTPKYPYFNFEIFSKLNHLFTSDELEKLENTNTIFREKTKKLSQSALKKEYERLLIELSWKSSKIEGNTYSLLDTEALIKNQTEAKGHKKEEALMILNHKKAIEYIYENKSYFQNITLSKIQELHEILTSDLGVQKGFRKSPVAIIGTNYKPLENGLQIRNAMENLVDLINKTHNILERALIVVLMISYIQPFEDGNKRTARILANAILYANDLCPISYRSVDEVEYKKGLIIFYENNSLLYFRELFLEQYNFAVEKYF